MAALISKEASKIVGLLQFEGVVELGHGYPIGN